MHSPKLCGITAMTAVGKLANFIRLCMAIGLAAAALLTFMIGGGILSNVLPIILYCAATIQVCAVALVVFDLSTAKWLIERVLTQLSASVNRLEDSVEELDKNIDVLNGINSDLAKNLDRSDLQVAERDLQLTASELQLSRMVDSNNELHKMQLNMHQKLDKFQTQLENNAIVNGNMQTLLKSMMDANAAGSDMNEVFQNQLTRLEHITDMLENTSFDLLDLNKDGVITKDEFSNFK